MELGSHGTETNGIKKDADKVVNPGLKGISAQQSAEIPVEELNAQVKDETLSNPQAEVIGTKNNPDETFTMNDQGPGFDDMIILDDGIVTSACLSEKGVDDASCAEPVEASQPLHSSTTVIAEVIAEIKDALKPDVEGLCLSETNAEKKGPEEENLNGIELSLTQDNGTEGSSEAQPMVVDEDGGLSTEKAKVSSGSKDGNLPAVAEDNTRKAVSVAESNEVTEQDIQSIKGQKVRKKFGKKSYSGDVVDYDPESKWFKVIYEDGDEEDLELWEVKEILTSFVSTPPTTRKRPRAEDENQKSSKKPKKGGAESTKKASKSGAKIPSKSPKHSKQSGTTKNAKGKSVIPNSSQVSRNLNTQKSPKQRSSPNKKKLKSLSSGKKQQKPAAKEKAEEASGKHRPKAGVAPNTESDNVLIGKHVKKDFDGKFYGGVVLKFDKKTQYYKVKYEDGDQEELELHELQPILVQENQIAETAEEKPAQ